MNADYLLCQLCKDATAEVVDVEHGAICFECHDHLTGAECALSFLISPDTKPTTHDCHE